MTEGRSELINPQRRLPDLVLPAVPGGAPCRLRQPGRHSPVLALVHGGDCAACGAFVAQLEAGLGAIEEWDGRPLVVRPEDVVQAGEAARSTGIPVLADPEQRLARSLPVRLPALVIADQWGKVHEAHEAGDDHRFLALDEVVSWLRSLAIQCPECQGEAF